MSHRKFKSDLSSEGLTELIRQLKHYADVDLPAMADMIVRRLADEGIKVADYTVYGDWREYVEFVYEPITTGTSGNAEGELVGRDITPVHRVWYSKSGQESEADVSALWMSEFGAGEYARSGFRGTFPGQKHAFQSVWYWYDASGNKHSSKEDYHMISTQPMYKALVAMIAKANAIVREVFNTYG